MSPHDSLYMHGQGAYLAWCSRVCVFATCIHVLCVCVCVCVPMRTGVDEHGVMLTSDYTRVIREAADKATQQDQQAREAEAAHEQGTHIVVMCPGPCMHGNKYFRD